MFRMKVIVDGNTIYEVERETPYVGWEMCQQMQVTMQAIKIKTKAEVITLKDDLCLHILTYTA